MAEQVVAGAGETPAVADFTAWMTAEQRRVFRLCLRMMGDADEADTATQDSFLKAYRALQKQELTPQDASRWLTRIAVNTCLDRLRSRRLRFWRRRPAQQDEEVILAMAASTAPDSEDQLFAHQIGARLAQALPRLSDRQRAVFALRHYEGRSLEEIGAVLGLDVGTVKAHMARAVARLRVELQDLYGALYGATAGERKR